MRKIDIKNLQEPPKNKRDVYATLQDFTENDSVSYGNIFIIYGLRRTGKTTMMEQYIYSHPEEKSSYYIAENHDSIKDLTNVIDKDRELGIKNIFIDEITKVEDFNDNVSVLADVYSKYGMKIVLTGTDSLGFQFAEHELYGREYRIPTTHISFAEHSRIFGTKDIDDYIRYGGLMKEGSSRLYVYDYESACKYLDESVSSNIANSICQSGKYNDLLVFDRNEIDLIVRKTVEQYSGQFNISKLQNSLKTASVYEPIKSLSDKAKRGEIELDDELLEPIMKDKKEEIVRSFLEKINAEKGLEHRLEPKHLDQLESLMFQMGVLSVVPIREFTLDNKNWINSENLQEYYIIQPAIKYYQLQEGTNFLRGNEYFRKLNDVTVQFLQDKLKEQIFGKMTEQIVLYDTASDLCNGETGYKVFKPVFIQAGANQKIAEYDMLIQDAKKECYWGFEIKHSAKADANQEKYLLNKDVKAILEENFGKQKGVSVLYRGKPFVSSTGTYYLNISDFLVSIHKTKDIQKTINELTNGLKTVSHDNDKLSPADVMEKAWHEYMSLPKAQRKKIIWDDKELRIAVFDDMYLAQCKKENKTPNKAIYEHFWKNCVDIHDYKPKYCDHERGR